MQMENNWKVMKEENGKQHIGQNMLKESGQFPAQDIPNDAEQLTMRDLTVGYDRIPLIKNIYLGVRPGEILTLLGPNGSGKSTILKTITKQLKTIGGSVFLGKESMRELTDSEFSRHLSMVMSERIHTVLLSGRDVVATGRYPYTGRFGVLSAKDHEAVQEAMEAVHVLEFKDRDFARISDGQRQRILLARASCQQPEILLLDEPTSYLDIRHKLELLEILRKMAKENGITVIMSLHEIDLAQKISDQVICVKGDRIAEFGDPEEIFTEATIRDLYEIDNGYYDPIFGSVELPKPEGEPEVLVLSSGKTGIPVYRKLQKAGIPFAAGILYPGESDYQLARLLASGIISEEPYEPISDETYQRTLEVMERCGKVINAGVKVGSMNQKMGELLRIAEERRMLVSI